MRGTFAALCTALLVSQAALAQSDSGERQGDRWRAYDLNHDGKLSHDEFNKGIAARFAAAAHGANAMSKGQYAAIYEQRIEARSAAAFRRLDWNGDGVLSLEEYQAPLKARFQYFDADGSGAETCSAAIGPAAYRPGGSVRNFARQRFCDENDLNGDGKVTREEMISVSAKRFTNFAGGKTMTLAQFTADAVARSRELSARIFARLDRDGDGKLSLAEFAASEQRLFARLDRNHDGVLTADEMSLGRRG